MFDMYLFKGIVLLFSAGDIIFSCGLVVAYGVVTCSMFCVLSGCFSTKLFMIDLQNALNHKLARVINNFSRRVIHNQNSLLVGVIDIYLHITNIAYWYYYILFNKKGSQCILN